MPAMVERGGSSLTNAQPTVRLAQIPAHFRMVRALLGNGGGRGRGGMKRGAGGKRIGRRLAFVSATRLPSIV